ncbi:hypothetical protein DPMN_082844 [Dreissena polymorpha]|uniref:Uncharacterized protein n=1 Tax=Dreissena polymorpha TaxID=45954 RepID=A0A9D3YA02_DREPO|nr:hypothetical protein DPMN_082844 [Dreissena polymorpha]
MLGCWSRIYTVGSINSPYNAKHSTSLMKSIGNDLKLITRFWKSDVLLHHC